MRMIATALLAILVAGAAILLAGRIQPRNPDLGQDREMVRDLAFEQRTNQIVPPSEANSVVLRAAPDGLALLSGFPSFQTLVFRLPVDARPVGGYVQIDMTTQVDPSASGVVRATINNLRRAEVLLRPGDTSRQFLIPLAPEELASDQVTISLSLWGSGPHPVCGKDTDTGAVVEIEPTSHMRLSLASPVDTLRDRVIVAGDMVEAGWTPMPQEEGQARLAAGAELYRRGLSIVFLPETAAPKPVKSLTSLDGRSILASLKASDPALVAARMAPGIVDESTLPPAEEALLPPTILGLPDLRDLVATGFGLAGQEAGDEAQWPVAVAETGPNAGVRRFYLNSTWRIPFDLRAMPDGIAPGTLDLDMVLAPLPADGVWTLAVSLNGRLVHVEQVERSARTLARAVALPRELQVITNAVEVTLTSSIETVGICNDGPELVAELTRKTMLMAGSDAVAPGLPTLRRHLAAAPATSLFTPFPLTAPEATLATRLVGGTIPTPQALQTGGFDTSAAFVRVLPRDRQDLIGSAPYRPGDERWLIWNDNGDGATPEVVLLDGSRRASDALIRIAATSPLLLMVDIPAGVTGVAPAMPGFTMPSSPATPAASAPTR